MKVFFKSQISRLHEAGEIRCPPDSRPAGRWVIVLDGEYPAAVGCKWAVVDDSMGSGSFHDFRPTRGIKTIVFARRASQARKRAKKLIASGTVSKPDETVMRGAFRELVRQGD